MVILVVVVILFLSMLVILGMINQFPDLKVKEVQLEYGEIDEKLINRIDQYLDFENFTDDQKEKVIEQGTVQILDIQKDDAGYIAIGEYEVLIEFKKQSEKTKLIIKDTTAPVFEEIEAIELYVGESDFDFSSVISCADLQEVTYDFDVSQIDFEQEGTYDLQVTAKDASGNSSVTKASVTVYAVPTASPQTTYYQSPSNTVTNSDTTDIDYLYGSTGDSQLDAMCDDVLTSIISSGMSDYQKLYAVYNWTESNIRYSGSIPIGDWRSGAITALTYRSGNCVGYCYVSEALLTRLGFENIEIHQLDNGHFWNMVKYNGSWYHFDTTRGWGTQRFLWTTNEIKSYSHQYPGYALVYYGEWDEAAYPATPD